MIDYCHPGMNSFGYKVHDHANYLNVQFPPIPSAQKPTKDTTLDEEMSFYASANKYEQQ